MSELPKHEKKTFKIRRGLDHQEKPAVEIQIKPDSDDTARHKIVPLTPDIDRWLTEVEKG